MHQGTGTAEEMELDERNQLASEGIVIASVDVIRDLHRSDRLDPASMSRGGAIMAARVRALCHCLRAGHIVGSARTFPRQQCVRQLSFGDGKCLTFPLEICFEIAPPP
jgi:hypothetical protein